MSSPNVVLTRKRIRAVGWACLLIGAVMVAVAYILSSDPIVYSGIVLLDVGIVLLVVAKERRRRKGSL